MPYTDNWVALKVAWQLSYFNEWMAWALLIMLALYDLFAVLTPCGPLKALVKLMSKDDAPSMPGVGTYATEHLVRLLPNPRVPMHDEILAAAEAAHADRRSGSRRKTTNQGTTRPSAPRQ